MLDEQILTLEDVASTMERMPTAKLILISHTEVQLDAPHSEELAASRARMIVDDLMVRGVSPHRVSVRPEGSGGVRDTVDAAMSNYVWFVFTDSAGAPLRCLGS